MLISLCTRKVGFLISAEPYQIKDGLLVDKPCRLRE